MILPWIVAILFIGGVLAWVAGRLGPQWPRWVSMIVLLIHLALLVAIWAQYFGQLTLSSRGPWLIEFNQPWIPQVGISFYLAMDGLSLLLLLLTNLLGIMGVLTSWNAIKERVGFFHFHLLWILSGVVGVFLALDLFLFYFFWEMMLVPLYFLIALWGHENRIYAAIKFFIFTQASGLLMLLGIIGLYFIHGQSTGVYTFNYNQLLGTPLPASTALWLMLGFFVAFAVKIPVVPLHPWLPDAHTEAPTAGSVDLAGLLLKVGAYGMIRFLVPLFPQAAFSFAPVAMVLGIAGILYGAALAFAQTDLKRLIAYTSISHMGFVLLGIFAWNELALQGAVIIMLAHGLSTGALFILVGDIQERIHTRELGRMGGMWSTMPGMGTAGMFFALASLGLPGLANFVGEFLVLLGVYQVNVAAAAVATIGFVLATVYALWMMQRVFFGPNREGWKLPDVNAREATIYAVLMFFVLVLGIYPQPVLTTAKHGLDNVQRYVARELDGAPPFDSSAARLRSDNDHANPPSSDHRSRP
ncbi:MAG: NADH-quinone oxidoreductase subunit M [Bacteroidetes bacterium]|nr:NADH-quinone oxidoreductase subunit M [Bacteroidota bacterium]MCL5026039.1 NADH-quinone oxidoreductase subunit M [Chloroflexota bacterium]